MPKVLLIEDDPLVSRMYSKVFEYEGFKVDAAVDGAQGLLKAKDILPDIILLDVMMPRMNGMEVLDAIQKEPKLASIPVVVLTNLSGTQDTQNALKRGAVDYLVKSEYRPKEVVEKVQNILSSRKSPAPAPKSTPAQAPEKKEVADGQNTNS